MVNSSPGTASWSLAVVLALLAVTAGLVWYFSTANGVEAGPAPAASATAAQPRGETPATPSSAAGAIERREAAPVTPPNATPPGERPGAKSPAVPEAATAATVHGRVVDVRGIGIADAKVAVLKQNELPAGMSLGLPREVRETGSDGVTTDAAGGFVLALRTLGSFELIASHDEHPSTRHGGAADGPRVDGVTIVLRDGGSISGRIEGAPVDAGELTVIARHVEQGAAALAGTAASAMFDFGGLFEGLDLPIGARRTAAAADRTFRLNGLEPGARFAVFAQRLVQDGQWTRCTERVEVSEGAHGVLLRWRETLAITVRVIDADTGGPIEDLDVSVGPVTKMVVLGMSMPIPMRQPVPQRHFPSGIVHLDGIGKDDKNPTLSLELRALGRRSWSRDDLDGTTRGSLDLGVVQLVAAPIVRVTVVCGAEPVAGAKVRLEQTEGDPTDESGTGVRRSITFSTTATTSAGNDGEPAQRRKIGEDDTRVATNDRGEAELTADFGGKARVIVESSHHTTCRGEPFVLPPRGVVEQRVVLWRGGTASVRVVDGHGAPLANATVRRTGADPEDTGSAKTDAHGALVFERLTPGAHSFAIEEAAKAAGGFRIDLGVESDAEAGAMAVEIGDGQVVDVLLTAPLRGSLRGIVTLDGQPLDRAEVRVVDVPRGGEADLTAEVSAAVESMFGGLAGLDRAPHCKTGVDGDYELANVRVGARRLVVTHKRLVMPASSDVTIAEGGNLHDVALRSTTVRGRVLDREGAPIGGASVAVWLDVADAATARGVEEARGMFGELFGGTSREVVRTAADGTFELLGVRPGVPLRVRASSRLHVADSVAVAAVPPGTARGGVELRLGPAGRVRVRVPVEGALAVKAEWAGPSPAPQGAGTPRSAMLKAGRATLDGLPPGRWKLTLEGSPALEARGLERIVEIVAGQMAAVEF